ncbi:N-acetyl-gamma-glutamyl-phosphate reductase [Sphingobium sufflavum]|uniref:N-acetyl-gamma-glutamyl-phosphate reductase n=1 Tax=Sphingobium sufflavum TaxID=1129547 RepID=UPI001F48773E|nr:N-acetyl-gamma-glutamyl-phosphate reductase [Sphingobium sufflavum]MCE7796102.1 N-acetyl-gamma-glutamyl-phosphate reductase [Sphingobium sufflavum]
MSDSSIFIDGAAGTTGLQIRDRLEGRSGFRLITLDDAQRKDPAAKAQALNDADVVILCLPDDAARESVALIRNERTRVIDASTAFRTADDWTYGLPEVIGRDRVAAARRISNPGCYPTGFLALVAPLVATGAIPADALLNCNAVSGYSGGGKAMIADYEGEGASPSAWNTYALTLAHKHVPEMRKHAGLAHSPIFAPSVAPLYSGMIVDVPLHIAQLAQGETTTSLRDRLAAHYAGSPIVSVADHDGATLPVELMTDTDALRLFVFGDKDGTQVRLVAALDNLGKGASGAAVQSLNLLTGRPETEGLRL